MRMALSQVSLVMGFGHSCIQPLLTYLPSQAWKSGTSRISRLSGSRYGSHWCEIVKVAGKLDDFGLESGFFGVYAQAEEIVEGLGLVKVCVNGLDQVVWGLVRAREGEDQFDVRSGIEEGAMRG